MERNSQAFERAELLLKYLRNDLSEPERADLEAWLKESEQNREFLKVIQDEYILKQELQFFSELDTNAAWKKIENKTNKISSSPKYIRFAKYAAAVLLLLTTGLIGYWNINREKTLKVTANKQLFKEDVAPGSDKATLTLGDGSVVNLDDLKDGDLKTDNGIVISKKGGQVVYQVLEMSGAAMVYNTISTPTGGQFQIILPDGSHVWLNAASSIRFPTSFKGNKRQVELKGEAYFEIAKNKHKPFNVVADDMQIEVLGTHFNVMAYGDEETVNTTLVEGLVRVVQNNNSKMLMPGQEAVYNKSNGSMKIRVVDLDQAIAWKKGLFLFNNTNLSAIMRQLSRWYNIKAKYNGELPADGYTGLISRNSNLSSVLNMLEMAGGVQFEIEDKNVKVTKEK